MARTSKGDPCPSCGRPTPLNKDGSLRAHRVTPEAGPYCPAGADRKLRAVRGLGA